MVAQLLGSARWVEGFGGGQKVTGLELLSDHEGRGSVCFVHCRLPCSPQQWHLVGTPEMHPGAEICGAGLTRWACENSSGHKGGKARRALGLLPWTDVFPKRGN